MRQIFHFILEQIFPSSCIGCDAVDQQLCNGCVQSVQFVPEWTRLHHIWIWSAYPYHQVLCERIMGLWKYKGAEHILRKFYSQIQFPNLEQFDALVFVPLHRKKQIERGFNQSEIFANLLSDSYEIPFIDGLKRVRNTKAQARLSRLDRLENLRQAFVYSGKEKLDGKRILIIDDVVSTGSTIMECVRAMKNEGAQDVVGICLFRGKKE